MHSPKHTQRIKRDEDIDAAEDRGDAALQRLLARKKSFIQCPQHMKRTKTIMQALTDEDLEDATIVKINGINGAINGRALQETKEEETQEG